MFWYNLLKIISGITVVVCWLLLFFELWKVIKHVTRKEWIPFRSFVNDIKSQALGTAGRFSKPILIIALAGSVVTSTAVHQLVGVHDLRLKPRGTYCFYVEASNKNGKTYTLPAEIRVEIETEDVGNDKWETHKYYYIEKVFFSNGGWLDVSDNSPTEIGDASYYYVRNAEEDWKLTLLNEHAYTPHVAETNNATPADSIRAFVNILPIVLCLLSLFCEDQSENDDEI